MTGSEKIARAGDHPLRRLLAILVGAALGAAGAVLYMTYGGAAVPVAAPLPPEPPVSVTFGEPFLTALVRDALGASQQGTPISDVVVDATDDALVVHGKIAMLDKTAPATATLQPVLRDGHLAIKVISTELGALRVPVEDLVANAINQRLNALLANVPVTLTGVSVRRDTGLTITCGVDLDRLQKVAR